MESKVERNGKKPLKVNDKIWIDITSYGKNGDGLGSYSDSNFIVIVPNTSINNKYKIKILKVTKSVAFGEIIQEDKENGK